MIVVAGELTLAVRQGIALSVALSPLLLIYRTSDPGGAGLGLWGATSGKHCRLREPVSGSALPLPRDHPR